MSAKKTPCCEFTQVKAAGPENCPQGVSAVAEMVLQHVAPQSSHNLWNLEEFLN